MSTPKIFDSQTDGKTFLVVTRASAGSLVGEEMGQELIGMLDEFDESDLENAVIDLEQSPYFGTSMLQVMTALWKRVRARAGRMALCNVSATGREVLHVTRFDTLWPICSSREEALCKVTDE